MFNKSSLRNFAASVTKSFTTQTMEKSLDSHLDDIMSEHGVIGVLCSDQQGLALSVRVGCFGEVGKLYFFLSTKGTANPMYAGLISSLAENAKQIYPDRVPVICLESDACNLLVRSEGNVTVAIHKVPS